MDEHGERNVEVVARHREDTAVVCGRVGHDEVGPFIGQAFGEVMQAIGDVPVVGPPFCRIDMAGEEFLLEVGFPVERAVEPHGRVVPSTLPAGTAATVLYTGPYDGVASTYWFLEGWMRDHGYVPDGAPWESYLDGPEVPEPRTVVCWPCRREDSAVPAN